MKERGTTVLVAATFAVLVAATFAAFFVTQRLKRSPAIVEGASVTQFFSPVGEGNKRARIVFGLTKGDDVTVAIQHAGGDVVRTLFRNRKVKRFSRVITTWDGRDDSGARVPDGSYRVRVGLSNQGRSVVIPGVTNLNTRRPRPRILRVSPVNPAGGPALLPRRDGSGKPLTVRYRGPAFRPAQFTVFRTDVRPAVAVAHFTGKRHKRTAQWNGLDDRGKPLPEGTYLIAVSVQDRAGNVGTDPSPLPPKLAALKVPGHGGVTVRRLAAMAPLVPTGSGADATFFVQGAGTPYRWTLRRVGEPAPRRLRTATRGKLTVTVPSGNAGVELLQLRRRSLTYTVPFAVRSSRPHKVLLVLPTITWQGRNPVDDDGDGLPDELALGGPVSLARPFARDGLPAGFRTHEVPLLVWLDRTRRRYDITTDLALADGIGPKLSGHSGVIIAGDMAWLPARLGDQLRAYVQQGGNVLSLGTGSLRSEVRLRGATVSAPEPATAEDLFGARIGPVRPHKGDITVLQDPPTLQLFAGTGGLFTGFTSWEPTLSVAAPGKIVAAAGTPVPLQRVIVAQRLGKGLVMRTGLPAWAQRIATDDAVRGEMGRMWSLLSR